MRLNKLARLITTTIVLLLLSGCTIAGSRSMPYDAWNLGFSAPAYMEMWVETANVVDIDGRYFPRAHSGNVAMIAPPGLSGNPKGWPARGSLGKSKRVLGANLPKEIYVRWQSQAEPQTYLMVVKIPEKARELMRKREKVFCAFDGKWITSYRNSIGIRLAPGGIAKVWVGGGCLPSIEVTTVKAIIARAGPYGQGPDAPHRPLSPISKAYVEKFGIPYDSWK